MIRRLIKREKRYYPQISQINADYHKFSRTQITRIYIFCLCVLRVGPIDLIFNLSADYTDYKQEKIFMAQFDKIVFLLQFILLLLLVVFALAV